MADWESTNEICATSKIFLNKYPFTFFISTKYKPKGISIIYFLQDRGTFTKTSTCNLFSNGTQIWIGHSLPHNGEHHLWTDHWEKFQRLLNCWYNTLHKLSKMNALHSPLCWRNWSEISSLPHIFWYRKFLTSYWGYMFHLLPTFAKPNWTPMCLLYFYILPLITFLTPVIHMLSVATLGIAKQSKKWSSWN